MTFIVDANVLIDLGAVNGLNVLSALGESEVLDVVLDECKDPVDLAVNIQNAGIQTVEAQISWIEAAKPYKTARLSLPDVLTFYYAKHCDRTVLTNERPLRNLCDREQVPFHGLLWITEQAYLLNLRTSQQLCTWLITLENMGSRLPTKELAQLREWLNCG